MNFNCKVELSCEAENEEDFKRKIQKMCKDATISMHYVYPCDGNQRPLPTEVIHLYEGSKLIHYEPLCPHGCTNCILDPAKNYLKAIIEKSGVDIVTRDMYPDEIEYNGCGTESDDDEGNCLWFDDEDK